MTDKAKESGERRNAVFGELRPWLAYLAETDRLAVARPGLGLRHEIAAVAKRLEGEKALLCPAPDGHDVPVVANVLGARSWIAEAMGVAQDRVLERFRDAADAPVKCREVATAPVQEEIERDVDILRALPVPTHNDLDFGPYISAALLISRDAETGVQNVSINRCQIAGRNRIGVLLLPRQTFALAQKAEAKGEALEIALVIGVDPLTLLASQAIAPPGQDELEIAGALRGAPLDTVKCVTNSVRVPANAEIVLEGRILPGVREPEGPFGEFPQYYGPRADRHVIEIDAITHRRKPLFHTITGGGLEHLVLGAIPREATILAHLRRSFTNVLDVHLSRGGTCRYHLVVKIDKRSEGEAKNIMLGAFAAHYDVKQVVVVDRDVNIYDPNEVEWALATRFQASRDLVQIHDAQGSKLDPSARDGIGSKTGFDATVPIEADKFAFTRIHVPGEETVDLNEILSGDAGAAQFLD